MTTLSPSPENVLLGKGKLLFDRFDANGNKQGYFHLGNADTFELSTEDDVVENQNSMIAAGGVYKSVTRSRTVNINIQGFEFSTQSLAIALMGDVTTTSQTTGTATAEALTTNATKGRFYRTAKRGISTITSLVQVAGTTTTTLTSGTDYSLYDGDAGIIQTLSGGAVTASATLQATYIYSTLSLESIAGAKASKIEGTLIYLPDPATGPSWEITAWKVSFNPNGATGFITDDFGTWSVTGKVLDDSAGTYGGSTTSPYYTAVQT